MKQSGGEWRYAATQHHERWEGGGYPQGLVGAEISPAGRIVAVADAFETITATRSYKEPSSREEGRAEIARCAGTQFDPAVEPTTQPLLVGGFPTLTPSSADAPTPAPAGAPSVLYMLNPGSGDTSYSPVLAMSPNTPTDDSLANYDTDRDDEPGLSIERGGSSVEDADSDEVQTWTYNVGPASISGQSRFRIYAAPDEDSTGEISATIDMCDLALNNCTQLATVTRSFSMGGPTFKKVNINFNLTAELTETQPVLRVRLWVPEDSDEDLWLAYDTASYQTRLELGVN